MIVNGSGAHLYTEVVGDVKVGKFSIDISVDYREEVYTDEAKYAEVALAAIVVFTILEHASKVVLIGLYVIAWGEEIFVASSAWVVIHDVEVGL